MRLSAVRGSGMNKRILFLFFWMLLTCMSKCFAAAGLLPAGTASPTPFSGNTIVNVSPGNGTISAAVNAHGGNTTYMLQNGNYTDGNINASLNHVQFIGSGPANVTVTSNGNSVFNNGGTSNFCQVWGMTINMAGTIGQAVGGNFSNLLIQNVHIQNFGSKSATETFPILLYGYGTYSPTNQTIDHCQFTAATSGNQGGISCIDPGAFAPAAYTNIAITNNQFDTPTDTGINYYHCMGSSCNTVSGNVWVAPNFSMESGNAFVYGEPGSASGGGTQNSGGNNCTITGNTVTLGPIGYMVGITMHPNGVEPSYVITGNTVHGNSSDAPLFGLFNYQGCSTVPPASGSGPPVSVNSVTIQNNAIDSGVQVIAAGCAIGTLVDTPNNGAGPTPTPTPCPSASANDTVVTTVGPTIADASCNVWALISGGQVSLNGSTTATNYTSGVTKIAYVSGVVWQYNGTNWYSFAENGSMASGPTSTSPLPAPTPTPTPTLVPTPVPTPKPTPTAAPTPTPEEPKRQHTSKGITLHRKPGKAL
jgi:hypothetical protein